VSNYYDFDFYVDAKHINNNNNSADAPPPIPPRQAKPQRLPNQSSFPSYVNTG